MTAHGPMMVMAPTWAGASGGMPGLLPMASSMMPGSLNFLQNPVVFANSNSLPGRVGCSAGAALIQGAFFYVTTIV